LQLFSQNEFVYEQMFQKKEVKRGRINLNCNPNSYVKAITLFSAFLLLLSQSCRPVSSLSEAHWMLTGQRFPASVHYGDSLRGFSTSRSFHKFFM